MRCNTGRTSFGLALLAMFLSVPIAGAQGHAPATGPAVQVPVTYWAVCRARAVVVAGTRHSYFSGVMKQGNVTDEDLGKAFAEFLATKYGAAYSGPECRSADTEAGAQSQYKLWMSENATRHYAQGEAVETGWTYTSPPSPAAS